MFVFFYGIEMSPMTMASRTWSATSKNSTNNSQLLGRSTHSVRLLVIYWPLLNEILITFSLSQKPGGNCCVMSSEAVGLRDVKGCFKLFKLIILWTLQCASLSSTMIFCIHVTVTVMVIVIVIVIMMISIIINNSGNLCCANYWRVAWENTWYQSCLDIIAKLMEWENP